jgi:sulfite reductase alpha subunit-like flavoprotein
METEIRSERTNGHVSLDVFARSLLVAYASETGSSQDYAEDLDQSLQRLHYRTELKEMNDVPLVGLALSPRTGSGPSLRSASCWQLRQFLCS